MMLEIITVAGIVAGLVAAGIQIRQHYRQVPRILNPVNGAKCGGRTLMISGVVPRRKRSATYWVAIQPSDCKGAKAGHPLREAEPKITWAWLILR